MKKIVLAAAALVLASGVAYAKPTDVTAKISAPVAEQTRVIASNAATGAALWTCAGDSCQARLDSAPNVRHCQALARKVGAVSAFADFDATKIAKCNEAARATTTSVAAK